MLNYTTDIAMRSGKILQDANTVESYNIEEKGFIVCMYSKVCSVWAEGCVYVLAELR